MIYTCGIYQGNKKIKFFIKANQGKIKNSFTKTIEGKYISNLANYSS